MVASKHPPRDSHLKTVVLWCGVMGDCDHGWDSLSQHPDEGSSETVGGRIPNGKSGKLLAASL
ncbi:hypothetical protein ACJMK2_005551 [Sinanodonta woodiana]|uniref:Uncharacterized protein n=1 Tax=Sinanodonta woodiana TaxID=1069815 RepID=A0ABD3VQV9_SINWO